jgi:hypothetical protein
VYFFLQEAASAPSTWARPLALACCSPPESTMSIALISSSKPKASTFSVPPVDQPWGLAIFPPVVIFVLLTVIIIVVETVSPNINPDYLGIIVWSFMLTWVMATVAITRRRLRQLGRSQLQPSFSRQPGCPGRIEKRT